MALRREISPPPPCCECGHIPGSDDKVQGPGCLFLIEDLLQEIENYKKGGGF